MIKFDYKMALPFVPEAEIVRLLGGEGSGAAATLADELLASCAAYKEQVARKK